MMLGRIRPTHAEIDQAAVCANAARVKAHVGEAGVIAVVKADAYGHGAVPVARALTGSSGPGPAPRAPAGAPIAGLAVSLAEEGLELRRAGIPGPILVMGGVFGVAHRDLVAHDLTPVVSELADVEAFARAGRPSERAKNAPRRSRDPRPGSEAQPSDLGARGRSERAEQQIQIHLKLDTGMARLGVRPEHLDDFLDGCAAFPNVRIAGFMTHLASADTDPELTRLQLDRFAAAVPAVRARASGRPLVLHAANTAGIFGGAAGGGAVFDAVRPGLALYGGGAPGLAPVMRFVTAIAQLRDIAPGDTVSYGGWFRARRPTRVATLPAGYADGYPRRLSSQLQPEGDPTPVLVRGRRCPVLGSVCMDMLMVDVTELGEGVGVGDEAVLFGRQRDPSGRDIEITPAELARRAGLIEYEITCGISKRVPRIYRS